MEPVLLDAAGRRRSPATLPGHHRGRPPRNKRARVTHVPIDILDGKVEPRASHQAIRFGLTSCLWQPLVSSAVDRGHRMS